MSTQSDADAREDLSDRSAFVLRRLSGAKVQLEQKPPARLGALLQWELFCTDWGMPCADRAWDTQAVRTMRCERQETCTGSHRYELLP